MQTTLEFEPIEFADGVAPKPNADAAQALEHRIHTKTLASTWNELKTQFLSARQAPLFEAEPQISSKQVAGVYVSGASSITDARACIEANIDFGISLADASERGLLEVRAALWLGQSHIFVDSGAIDALKQQIKMDQAGQTGLAKIDFEAVFKKYKNLIDPPPVAKALIQSGDLDPKEVLSRLLVCGPDVIGNQQETLNVLKTHRQEVIDLMNAGVNVMINIQNGLIPAHELLEIYKSILGREDFVLGIPSARHPTSREEVRKIQHPWVHLLGKGSYDDAMKARITDLTVNGRTPQITGDACMLRSLDKAISRHRAQVLSQLQAEQPTWEDSLDETEEFVDLEEEIRSVFLSERTYGIDLAIQCEVINLKQAATLRGQIAKVLQKQGAMPAKEKAVMEKLRDECLLKLSQEHWSGPLTEQVLDLMACDAWRGQSRAVIQSRHETLQSNQARKEGVVHAMNEAGYGAQEENLWAGMGPT